MLGDYINENKFSDAREVPIPSIEEEYQCATNFNKETLDVVLSFAKESKKELLKSASIGELPEV